MYLTRWPILYLYYGSGGSVIINFQIYMSYGLSLFRMRAEVWGGSTLRGDSTGRRNKPMRGIKRPTCGTLNKYLVGAIDLSDRPTNIVNLFIVLCSQTCH